MCSYVKAPQESVGKSIRALFCQIYNVLYVYKICTFLVHTYEYTCTHFLRVWRSLLHLGKNLTDICN